METRPGQQCIAPVHVLPFDGPSWPAQPLFPNCHPSCRSSLSLDCFSWCGTDGCRLIIMKQTKRARVLSIPPGCQARRP